MKNLIIFGILAVLGYFGYSYLREKQKQAAINGKKKTLVGVAIGIMQGEKNDEQLIAE